MSKIKVSVIIPVFNSENFLEQCLDSVINQSLKDFELICVDDGSTDSSLEILKKYEKNDSRVIVISQNNSGAGIARNKGMEIAKGEYIAFIDSDDWIENDALEKLYNHILANDSDMALFNSIEHKPDNTFRERIYFPKKESFDYDNFSFDYHYQKEMVMNRMLVIWSKFYKTSFLKENDIYFPNHEIFNDVQFHIKTMLLAKKISYLPEILYNYRRINQPSLQNSRAITNKGFIIFDIFAEIEEYLHENGYYEEFRVNFLKFVLNESRGRLNKTNLAFKDDLIKILKDKLLTFDISSEDLKKIGMVNYKFYIHVINSDSYFEFKHYSDVQNISFDSDLIQKQQEDIKILKNKYDNLNDLINEFLTNLDRNVNLVDRIKKFGLFDEDFYRKEYDYDDKLDPIVDYIFKGHKEGKKPNNVFDNEFYFKHNKNVNASNLDPFMYFVLYGIDEGNIRINKSINQPHAINKIELSPKIRQFDKKGVVDKFRDKKLIISLTSFPERMYDVHFCLYSLLNQSLKPDKVILWLAKNQFPNREKDVPQKVLSLKENGLEIMWCDDLKSYKKFIPSLKLYPEDIIITADDDIFYPSNWLKELYDAHLEYPNDIISHRSKIIQLDDDKNIKEYCYWDLCQEEMDASYMIFSTNGAGTLFPPHSLDNRVLDYELAEKLCSSSDDVWIWCMAILNRSKIRVVKNNMPFLNYINPAREYNLVNEKTLWAVNSLGENDKNLTNMINNFPEIKKIILDDIKGS